MEEKIENESWQPNLLIENIEKILDSHKKSL